MRHADAAYDRRQQMATVGRSRNDSTRAMRMRFLVRMRQTDSVHVAILNASAYESDRKFPLSDIITDMILFICLS